MSRKRYGPPLSLLLQGTLGEAGEKIEALSAIAPMFMVSKASLSLDLERTSVVCSSMVIWASELRLSSY